VSRPAMGARGTSCSAWHDQHFTTDPACSTLTRRVRPHLHLNWMNPGMRGALSRSSTTLTRASSSPTKQPLSPQRDLAESDSSKPAQSRNPPALPEPPAQARIHHGERESKCNRLTGREVYLQARRAVGTLARARSGEHSSRTAVTQPPIRSDTAPLDLPKRQSRKVECLRIIGANCAEEAFYGASDVMV
jgi:hypothetical protein